MGRLGSSPLNAFSSSLVRNTFAGFSFGFGGAVFRLPPRQVLRSTIRRPTTPTAVRTKPRVSTTNTSEAPDGDAESTPDDISVVIVTAVAVAVAVVVSLSTK